MTPFRLALPAASPGETVIEAHGEATKVYLELLGYGTIEGEGIVHVVKGGSDIGEWLSQIDPDELEKAALDRMGGFGSPSTGAAVLEVLRGWAGGGA